jgi:ribosomal protein S18 acetylase RimI-like enzyme
MNDSAVHIRCAVPTDAAAIARMHVRSWRATYASILAPAALAGIDVEGRMATWTDRLSTPAPGEHTLLGILHRPVGFVHFAPSPDHDDNPHHTGQVIAIHVDPDIIGRGVGKALLTACLRCFWSMGYRRVTLWVVASNERARRFYERAGWTPDGGTRRERLALPGEPGEEVTVVRYQQHLTEENAGDFRNPCHVR